MNQEFILRHASCLRKLEKSWGSLLSLGVLCSALAVFIFFQSLSLNKPAFRVFQTQSIIIPEIELAAGKKDQQYEQILLQVVQNSRKVDFFKAREISRAIIKISLLHKVDPLFVAAMIQEESRFRDSVYSNKGAVGLMQLKPSTASYVAQKNGLEFDDSHLLDHESNIFLGISYLKYLSKKFNGNLNLILAAYNWGPGNVQSIRGDVSRLPPVTKKYVHSISTNYRKWKQARQSI